MNILREEWLEKAKDIIIEKIFKPNELEIPPLTKVACGPCPAKALGMCVYPNQAEDGATHIFISPSLGSEQSIEILSTLVHELVHSHVIGQGYEVKHGFPFSKIIRTVGLEGKPAATFAAEGTELFTTLQGISATLGEYPHRPLIGKVPKKRVSEILTWVSTTDPEYTVKAKYSMTEEKGTPRDHNGEPMEVKDKEKLAELQDRSAEDTEEQEAAALPE